MLKEHSYTEIEILSSSGKLREECCMKTDWCGSVSEVFSHLSPLHSFSSHAEVWILEKANKFPLQCLHMFPALESQSP